MAYPNLITLQNCGVSAEKYLDVVYQAYMNELVNAGLTFQGIKLSFRYTPATEGRGYAFWHAISENWESQAEEDRIPDPRRCERITWTKYVLSKASDDGQGEVLWWRTVRRGKSRIVLWLKDESYAVVIEDRTEYWLFITAYCVRPRRAEKFAEEHAEYWGLPLA